MNAISDASAESFERAVDLARKRDLAGAAGHFMTSLIRFYALPENQAFLAGAMAGALFMASRTRRFLPGFLVSYASGLTAQKAYLMAAEVRDNGRITAENIEAVGRAIRDSIKLNVTGEPGGADVPAEG